MNAKTTIFGLLIIFLILNVVDILTTIYVIDSGKGIEANPIMAYLMHVGDYPLWAFIKLSVALIIVTTVWTIKHLNRRVAKIVTVALTVFYVFVVLNNTIVITEAKYCDYFDCKNIMDIGFVTNKWAKFTGAGSNKGQDWSDNSQVVVNVKVTSPKLPKELHIQGNGLYLAEFKYWSETEQKWVYFTTYYYGETYDLTYNGIDYGDLVVYHRPDGMDIYFVWDTSNNVLNLPYGTMLTATRKSIYHYWGSAYSFSKMMMPKHCDQTYGSFDDPDLAGLIKFRLLSCNAYCTCSIVGDYEDKNIENIPHISEADVVYYVETFGTMEFCIDEQGNILNAFEIDTSSPYRWLDYETGAEVKNGTGKADFIMTTTPVILELNNMVTFSAINETCLQTEGVEEGKITFYFIDSDSGALLDSVNFSISGSDFNDSGVYDYYVTYNSSQLTEENTYSYTATKDGYQPVSGSFTFTGGQVIKLYFVPSKESFEDEMDDPVNNTVLTFTVLDSETKEPVEGATVTLESYSKLTNENGFTWFEVQKNGTYRYRVSKEGYYPISGTVNVGENQTDVTVELIPYSAIPTTTPAGGGDTGGGTGGGEDGESGTGGGLESGINELYTAAPTLIQLAILVAIVSLLGMMIRAFRRR